MVDEVIVTADNLDFEASSQARKNTIKNLIQDSTSESRIPNLSTRTTKYKVITLPLKNLIYNVDNTRVRSFLQDDSQIYDIDGDDAVDEMINSKYEEMNNIEMQIKLHTYLFEDEAQDENNNIYLEIKNSVDADGENPQGDYLLIDNQGIVVDGNRRLSAIREVFYKNKVSASALEQIECVVLEDENGVSTRELNKQIENELNITRNLQKKHHWFDQDGELNRQYQSIYEVTRDNENEAYLTVFDINGLEVTTGRGEPGDRAKINTAKQRIDRYKLTNQFFNFKKTFEDSDYTLKQLKNEDIMYDMNAMTKYISMRDGDEKRLKLLFGFAFISGHKIGGLSRRSYDYLNSETQFDAHLNAYKKAYRVSTTDNSINKLTTTILDKPKETWPDFTQKVIDKKNSIDRESQTNQNNQAVLNGISEARQAIMNTDVVMDNTILRNDVPEAISKVNDLIDEVKELKQRLEEL